MDNKESRRHQNRSSGDVVLQKTAENQLDRTAHKRECAAGTREEQTTSVHYTTKKAEIHRSCLKEQKHGPDENGATGQDRTKKEEGKTSTWAHSTNHWVSNSRPPLRTARTEKDGGP